MTPIGLFRGEHALVTGSASNIGRAIALALAPKAPRSDASMSILTRNAAAVADIISAGGSAEAVTADLSTTSGWRSALPPEDQSVSHLRAFRLASAARSRRRARRLGGDLGRDGQHQPALGLLPRAGDRPQRMQAAGTKGRMLFITSLHAETPRNIPHYAASKAGQTMVVKELARALGPAGIRVNALAPGAVPGGGFNAAAFSFDGKIPLGRLGKAEDMANMALALLSDRFSGYVTGTTVAVDGGIALYNWIPLPSA